MRKHKSFLVIGGLVLAFGLLMLGSLGTPTGQAQELRTIKVGVGPNPSLLFLQLSVAQAQGYLDELTQQGIKVEVVSYKGGAETQAALFSGEIDFGNMAIDHAFRSVARGGPEAKMLVTFLETLGLALIVHKDLADQVQSVADLKGKKIGMTVANSGSHLLGIRLVKKAGLDPDKDVTFVGVGSGSTALEAMANKTVDAVIQPDPTITDLAKEGHKILVDVRTPEQTRELYGNIRTFTGLQTLTSFLETNKEIVRAIVKAYAKAVLWIAGHTPEEIATILKDKAIADYDPATITANLPGMPADGLTKKEGVETAMKALIEDGILPADFNQPAERFYDNSLLEEALQQLGGS